jgi:2-C-methyl-D-erythritol 4-phosphate cytidylyltransferase / 2-C-methyl-D-erythritol 2,4-cyclodiphosphate synthase
MQSANTKEPALSACAIIVAAGKGERARQGSEQGAQELPKQFMALIGRPLVAWALEALAMHPQVKHVILVVPRSTLEEGQNLLGDLTASLPANLPIQLVAGGATRQESVCNALEAYGALESAQRPQLVLVHDGARPFVSQALIQRVLNGLENAQGAIPALALTDTLKTSQDGRLHRGPDRDGLLAVQTPQGFVGQALLEAHRAARLAASAGASALPAFTDDASMLEWHGLACMPVEGESENIKITTPGDWQRADAILRASGIMDEETARQAMRETRTGIGYDVHRLVPGDGVWLCGHFIAHSHRLDGHSDADVGLHALTDALLGTIGAGDIGTHFPPSQPQWKGAASSLFLAHAARLVRARGGRIIHVDVAIVAENPKIGPHRQAMIAAMAQALGIAPSRVSVKATTNERLGFAGREEGIAAFASATVELPASDD